MTKRMKQITMVCVPVLVLVGALIAWLQGGRHISTENAFVKADIAQIASEVPGRITEVRIQDHSAVAAGDVLLRLDPTPYQLALAKPKPKSIPRVPQSSSSRPTFTRSGPKPERRRTSCRIFRRKPGASVSSPVAA